MAVGVVASLVLLALYAGPVWSHEIWSNELLTREVEKMSGQITALTVAGNKLEDKVENLTESLAAKEKEAAFLAQADLVVYRSFRTDSPLRFDKVIFNTGNGYNSFTGVFKAPYPGTYVFSFQLFPRGSGRTVLADLVKNGYVVLRSRGGSAEEETLTASTIQQAQRGDRFWITIREGAGIFHGKYHTFFSGALISPNK